MESGNWNKVENCGQPRSELNSCFRKQQESPQFSITLGPCPETSLVHRQSLTQNLKCIGSFQKSGLDFVVTKGSEYEFWQEGSYLSHDQVHRCFAYKTFSNQEFIKMSQGIGSDCNGMSGDLNFDTGLRGAFINHVDRKQA